MSAQEEIQTFLSHVYMYMVVFFFSLNLCSIANGKFWSKGRNIFATCFIWKPQLPTHGTPRYPAYWLFPVPRGHGEICLWGKGEQQWDGGPSLGNISVFPLKKKKKGKPNYLQSKLIIAQRFDTTVCDVTGKLVGAHQLSLRWLQVWGQRMCGTRASAHVLWVLQGTATHCWLWWWQLPPASADLLLQVCD